MDFPPTSVAATSASSAFPPDCWCSATDSFNPLYGQGMSVAALEAIELRRCLHQHGDQLLARRFFRAAGKIVDQTWDIAIGDDLALPDVEGPAPRFCG